MVRKITPTGTVSRYAGMVGVRGTVDGGVDTATFDAPTEMAIDRAGSIYFVDGEKLRKISGGMVATLFSRKDLVGSSGIAVSADGTLAVSGMGILRVFSQNGTLLNTVDNDRVTQALAPVLPSGYFYPNAPVFDSNGNVYVADQLNGIILKLSKDYTLTRFSGKPRVAGTTSQNTDGPANTATFAATGALTIDTKGNLYLQSLGSLRMITPWVRCRP